MELVIMGRDASRKNGAIQVSALIAAASHPMMSRCAE